MRFTAAYPRRSNSVLVLFRSYPGDPTLQGYLKCAMKDGLLTPPRFVTTFLLAAQSPDLHHTATLDMLCRVVLDAHYATGLPALGSIIPYSESPSDLLATAQNAMSLLRTAHQLPPSHFHQLTTSASELLTLLISCVSPADISQLPTAQVMMHFAEASDLLQIQNLIPAVRQELETFALSLSLLLGDDAKAAREAQMMHTLQLAYGKGDIMGPTSDTDLVTCGLVLHSFVRFFSLVSRAGDFGAGDSTHAVAVLVALFRWLSWSPTAFFSQLLLAAASCVAQSAILGSSTTSMIIWRAFVVGRLPELLCSFKKTAEAEGLLDGSWHAAIHMGLTNLLRVNILDKCDSIQATPNGDITVDKSIHSVAFALEFLHQMVATDIVDASFAATISPTLSNSFTPRITTEARDAGMDVASYLESKLVADNNNIEEAVSLAGRVCRDACSHSAFAAAVHKRFTSLSQPSDVESLSHICKVMCRCEPAVDIVSIHVSLRELLSSALAFVEGYDCETVGDPQTAVSHLGEVVLFLQEMVARHNVCVFHAPSLLTRTNATTGDRKLDIDFILPVATVYPVHELKGEAAADFQAWNKALFDKNSEGIEDSILRNTRPQTLLRITASLFANAINLCLERKMEKEVLVNGIQYFLGNLLNWTLAGTVKWLLAEIRMKGYNAPVHLEVLQTLLLSPSCPQAVLRLSAPTILRLFPWPHKQERSRTGPFDPSPIRRVALQTLGLPPEGNPKVDHAMHAIRNALAAGRAGKAPAFDLDRCLLATTPARFLSILWRELIAAATMGEMDAARRLATFIMTTPRHSHSPPLLPIFLHAYLPGIVAGADSLPPSEQAITVELIVSVVASALTAALHLERALLTVCNQPNPVLGQSAAAMARNLGSELRSTAHGHNTSSVITQRLTSSPAFVTNFPTFMAEL
ncbi:hypothetical protein DAEQUDRAFT_743398 [Daedalea quercina L-15889]|uniref:Mediator of RNA polymerase II transcription subunit 5 n=1 Tax=Daedalea quercina L-15889 TaxID=1314783 RepID=A0A165T053_9APHY|nr:hypothetical protein DAEQUDRAFT_743398 [Daedalea quercina L-15889]